MRLPVKTHIPLEVLDSPIEVYLDLTEREKNALRKSGITRTWHLLLYSARYMQVLEGIGRKLYPRIVAKMHAKSLPIHGLAECSVFWLQNICLSDGTDGERVRLFQAVTAEAGGRLWERNFDTVEAFRQQHGVQRFMKIDQLFVNGVHAPLTDEQIGQLWQSTRSMGISHDALGWVVSMRRSSALRAIDVYMVLSAVSDCPHPELHDWFATRGIHRKLTTDEVKRVALYDAP